MGRTEAPSGRPTRQLGDDLMRLNIWPTSTLYRTLLLSLSLGVAACSGSPTPGAGPATDTAGADADASDSSTGPGRDTSAPDADTDGDGLLDSQEDINANGVYDGGENSNETNWQDVDTDHDGLQDGDEDANLNGRVDPGETDPRAPDTDGDGINDGDEYSYETDPTLADTDGDGIDDGVEVSNGVTDPRNPDSDGDGLLDGDEDRNHNGVVDLTETDPNNTDTDGDGVPDIAETLAISCAASASPGRRVLEDYLGDWHLDIPSEFSDQTRYDVNLGGTSLVHAAYFQDPTTGVYAFVISKPPADGVERAQDMMAGDIIRLGHAVRVVDRTIHPFATWDGFYAANATVRAQSSEQEASLVRDEIVAQILGLATAMPDGSGPAEGPRSSQWTIRLSTVYRSSQRIIVSGAIVPATDTLPDIVAAELSDATNTTTLSQFGDETYLSCRLLALFEDFFAVDFLWLVDDSLSMRDDQATIAEAADRFYGTLNSSFLDYRAMVISTDLRDNTYYLVDPGFSDFQPEFEEAIQSPYGGDLEFGLETTMNVLRLAATPGASVNQRFRPGAKRVIIYLSDEDDQTIKIAAENGDTRCDGNVNPSLDGCGTFDAAVASLLANDITAYAITGDTPSGCTSATGPGNAEEAGHAYIQAAYATGGSYASICSDDLGETVDRIVRSAIAAATNYALGEFPISSSIRVVRNGNLVPRSNVNGWDYDPTTNQIIFFGEARPNIDDEVAMGFDVFEDVTADPTGYVPAG